MLERYTNKTREIKTCLSFISFSKICEKFIQESLNPFLDNFLSESTSTCRKTYSTDHVLLRLIEQWKSALDNKNFVEAVLMDLSKVFDCLPHDLPFAKLHTYGKPRKQCVKINNTYSIFKELLYEFPPGSILGPIFFFGQALLIYMSFLTAIPFQLFAKICKN